MFNVNVYVRSVADIRDDEIGVIGRDLSALVNAPAIEEHLLLMNLPSIVEQHKVPEGTSDAMTGQRSTDHLRTLQTEIGKGAMKVYLAYSKEPDKEAHLIGSLAVVRDLPLHRQLFPIHHSLAELAPGVLTKQVDPHTIGDNLVSWFDPRRESHLEEMASALFTLRQRVPQIRPELTETVIPLLRPTWTVVPQRVFERYPDYGVALTEGGYADTPDSRGYYYNGESPKPPKSVLYITQPPPRKWE